MTRLDFLSPLPPVRSGISDYSADLLPHLAEQVDVRVVRVPRQAVAPDLEERWRPMAIAELGSGGRLPLYQMGNNPYHEEVFQAALALPGVLTLHDLLLHHLLVERTLSRRDWEGYRAELAADEGWAGEAAARARLWAGPSQAALFGLLAHRRLLRRQRGVLVHSDWAARLLAEEDPELRVRSVPMGIPLPPLADREHGIAFRRRHGLPLDAPLLGSFGFQTPIKRTEVLIGALAAGGLEDVHLLIVGESSPGVDFLGVAQRHGVVARVHHLDFLPYAEFQAAIAATEACVNLRYPSAGETSASLLRLLAAGRPVVVSDFAQFAELPEDVAVRAPLGEGETLHLASVLREILATPERLRAMGVAARAHVRRRHDPQAAAVAVADACAEWAGRPAPGDQPTAMAAPTSLIWHGDLAGRIDVAGAEAPWRDGERRRLRARLTNQSFARWLGAERGEGGLALEIHLHDRQGGDLLAGQPWLLLDRDLNPGESQTFEIDLRRPVGPARLRLEPRILGREPLWAMGGPVWERDL